MRSDQAFKLAYAVAFAVRPERKEPKGRLAHWWARKRLTEDEVARHALATECAKAIQMVACPEEWQPEAVARRTLDQVLRALWATGHKGIQDHIRLSRATVIVDEAAKAGWFAANVALGGETVRLHTLFNSVEAAEGAAEAWIQKIGAVSASTLGSGKTRSVEVVPSAPMPTVPDPDRPGHLMAPGGEAIGPQERLT